MAEQSDSPAPSTAADPVLEQLIAGIERRNASGIASAIGRMVTAGELAEGARLPTVRELAAGLGISPTTVSDAWRTLASVGAIEPRGRRGTFVRNHPGPGGAQRYRRVTEGPGHFDLDLSTGTPDTALLPALGPTVARVGSNDLTTTYVDPPVLPALERHLRATWPFPPEAVTVVDGAMDALDRIAAQVVRHGDQVIVEHPTFPPVLDLLDRLGAEVIGVELDKEGMRLDRFRAALTHRPSLVFLQPRAQNPTGVTMSGRRADALADLLRSAAGTSAPGPAPIVVEDDHSGDIASGALASIGARLPRQTVHIRGFSKSHGPDLRLAAVGGAGPVVEGVIDRRLLGPGWSSRILQAVLLDLLTDPEAVAQVDAARVTYARRRTRLVAALAERGVTAGGTDGINVWVPVADERSAVVTLAAQSIGVAPGEPFCVLPDGGHIRVTVGLVPDGDPDGDPESGHRTEQLADQIARAATGRAGADRRPRT